jgi:hypothetical protein
MQFPRDAIATLRARAFEFDCASPRCLPFFLRSSQNDLAAIHFAARKSRNSLRRVAGLHDRRHRTPYAAQAAIREANFVFSEAQRKAFLRSRGMLDACQRVPPLGAPPRQHLAAILGFHSRPEAMLLMAPANVRLKGALRQRILSFRGAALMSMI